MINIGVISYAAGSIFFLILSLLLLISRRGRREGVLLLVACAISALWAGLAAYDVHNDYPSSLLVTTLELLRDWFWAVFLVRLMKLDAFAGAKASPILRGMVSAVYAVPPVLILLVCSIAFTGWTTAEWMGFDVRIFGFLLISVLGLALVEQLFRNTETENRWAVKYLCFGVGIIFAYDFYLYADALLYKQIDAASWIARGLVNAIAAPLIAIAAARNPQWSLNVSISRTLVFHGTAIAGSGAYLVAMALGGYYIRFYGGEWGGILRDVFLVGAVMLLLVMLFSGQMRARVKVFITKHFFNYKYDYRDEWLRFIRTLSLETTNEALREKAIQALMAIIDSPGGILFRRQADDDFKVEKTLNMLEPSTTERHDGSLALFLERWQWVINVDEYKKDPKLYEELELPHWLYSSAQVWLVVPLMLQATLYGFVVLARPRAPRDFNWEDIDLLRTAGRQVAIHLAQAEAAEALTEARQFEAFNRLSAYVVHDLKNLVAQLSLVVSNAKKHKDNPAFMEDAIATVDNSVARMNRLLVQLRSGGKKSEEKSKVALLPLLKDVIAEKSHNRPRPSLENQGDAVVAASKEKLFSVIGHIIQNAQEATADNGVINVRLKKGQHDAIIEVQDTGCGMEDSFIRERLFRPFDTTKGLTGMGIGVYEAREYIRSLGGAIQVSSQPGHGTLFIIRIPLVEIGAADCEIDEPPVSGVGASGRIT